MNKKNNEFIIDKLSGVKIYPSKLNSFRLGTIDDFHLHGIKNIGMKYLIYNHGKYEEYTLRDDTTSEKLMKYINDSTLFVFDEIIKK